MKYSLEHGNNNYRFFFVHITSLVVALDPWCVPNRAAGVLSSGVAAAIVLVLWFTLLERGLHACISSAAVTCSCILLNKAKL